MIITCVQFHNELLNKELPLLYSIYNDKIIEKYSKEGYVQHKEFYELPKWVGIVYNNFKYLYYNNKEIEVKLEVIKDIFDEKVIANLNNSDYILFSIGNFNKDLVQDLIQYINADTNILIGGYISLKNFNKKTKAYNTIKEMVDELLDKLEIHQFVEYKDYPDYNIFNEYFNTLCLKTIPRISIVDGCFNKCTFCSVNRSIKCLPISEIGKEFTILLENDLDYKLIYINDKSFGDKRLYNVQFDTLKHLIHTFDYEGKFIIQSNINSINENFLDLCIENNIWGIELGIEIFSDNVLLSVNKQQTEEDIQASIYLINEYNRLNNTDIKIIPNFIIGLPKATPEDYQKTLEFIKNNHFTFANVFLYEDGVNYKENDYIKRNSISRYYYEQYLKLLISKL